MLPVMSVDEVIERDERLRGLLPCLVEGVDYDPGPGGKFGAADPSLLQPGAEKLAAIFGLSLISRVTHRVEDFLGANHGEPLVTYEVTCDAMRDGVLICSGLGVCTSAESGFRWRWVGVHDVPPGMETDGFQVQRGAKTEFRFAIDRAETVGQYGKPPEYWAEFQAAISDGSAVYGSKPGRSGRVLETVTIETALVRIPNPDMAVLANPILKRAKKRAVVAAVITAIGGLSAIFTQDAEEDNGLPRRVMGGGGQAGGGRAGGDDAAGGGQAGGGRAGGDDAAGGGQAGQAGGRASWSASPAIERMKSPADLMGEAGVMALIQVQLPGADNVYHRNGAWVKALIAACGLARTEADYHTIETAWSKVSRLITKAHNDAVSSAVAGVLDRVFADTPPATGPADPATDEVM